MVVNFLSNPVDGVLLLIDYDVVFANYSAETLNLVIHFFLVDAQTVDFESRLGVDGVENPKSVVQFTRFKVELLDLLLFGLNGSVEVLDLEIEHKLELFQLLGLFLQLVNLLLPDTNVTVLLGNFLF